MTELPTHSLSDRQLKLSYWYLTNKLKLKRYLVWVSVVLNCLLFGYIAWQLLFWVVDYQKEQYIFNQLVYSQNQYLNLIDNLQPQELQFSGLSRFDTTGGRYDFMVEGINVNANWLATFDYQFVSNNDKTLMRQGFLMPGQKAYIMDLGIDDSMTELRISNKKWHRVTGFKDIYDNRFGFAIGNEQFIAGSESGDPNILSFEITNDSAYSYWQVPIQSFLYTGGGIVSINFITLEQLRAGETRQIELYWNNVLPRITSYDIFPYLNILDEDNIMPIGADGGSILDLR